MFPSHDTTVEIYDESGGEFVCIKQHPDSGDQEIRIDPEEWPTLREAIDRTIADCRRYE